MTTDVDICNRALAEIGARVIIASLAEATPAAKNCNLLYNPMRQQILRAAPWAFARKTLAITPIGLLTDNPPASPYPWLAKYLYPAGLPEGAVYPADADEPDCSWSAERLQRGHEPLRHAQPEQPLPTSV
jgi:hypothetical protein